MFLVSSPFSFLSWVYDWGVSNVGQGDMGCISSRWGWEEGDGFGVHFTLRLPPPSPANLPQIQPAAFHLLKKPAFAPDKISSNAGVLV